MPSTIHFISTDLRGSTRCISAADGKPAAWFDYGPCGDSLDTQTSGDANLAARLTRRFTGQAFDAETALYHYGARLYDDQRAGFVSADPAHLAPSPYAYCANDPVDHVDPDGRAPHWVVYFNGWFLILDEHNVVKAIFGDSDSALKDDSTITAIDEYLSDTQIDIFTTPPILRQQLAELADSAKRRLARIRSRPSGVSAVVNAALDLVKKRGVRVWIQGGLYRGLRRKAQREQLPVFQSRRQVKLPTTVNPPSQLEPRPRDTYRYWETALRRKDEHKDKVKSRSLSYIFRRPPLNPAKYTVNVEYWYSIFLDNLDNPALQPDPRLYLFLRRGGLPADLDPQDRARIDAHIKAVDAQLPSNTTAVTSPTAHDVDDDETHESQTEEESEHIVPAKPGGEKPYMPSDDDTESL